MSLTNASHGVLLKSIFCISCIVVVNHSTVAMERKKRSKSFSGIMPKILHHGKRQESNNSVKVAPIVEDEIAYNEKTEKAIDNYLEKTHYVSSEEKSSGSQYSNEFRKSVVYDQLTFGLLTIDSEEEIVAVK